MRLRAPHFECVAQGAARAGESRRGPQGRHARVQV